MRKITAAIFRIYHFVVSEAIRPRTRAMRRLLRISDGRIIAGPFASMRYLNESVGSVLHAKILGTYELELHEALERICAAKHNRIIDVGAAEGYYAIGLARRCPQSQIVAFEMDEHGRELLHRLADLNQVNAQIQIRGTCDIKSLRATLDGSDRAFILIDAEGAEQGLLDPNDIPQLRTTTMLVELHEHLSPGIGALLRKRFGATHSIEEFQMRKRTRQDLPDRAWPYWWWMLSFTNECRPVRQTWMLLEPQGDGYIHRANANRNGVAGASR